MSVSRQCNIINMVKVNKVRIVNFLTGRHKIIHMQIWMHVREL